MKPSEINEWLHVFATLGVVASLIFVGFQIKQTHEIALSSNYQSRTAIIVERNTNLMGNQILLSAQEKMGNGQFDDLTSQEEIVLNQNFYNYLLVVENNHYQYQAGFLSEEHWQRNLWELVCNFEHPFYREVAAESTYRESFEAVIDNAIAEAAENPTGCWD